MSAPAHTKRHRTARLHVTAGWLRRTLVQRPDLAEILDTDRTVDELIAQLSKTDDDELIGCGDIHCEQCMRGGRPMSAPDLIRLRDIPDELTRLRDENRELRAQIANLHDRISHQQQTWTERVNTIGDELGREVQARVHAESERDHYRSVAKGVGARDERIRAYRKLVHLLVDAVDCRGPVKFDDVREMLVEALDDDQIGKECPDCEGHGTVGDERMIGDPGAWGGYKTESYEADCGCFAGRVAR